MLYKILILSILFTLCTWTAQGDPGCRDGITKNVTSQNLIRQDIFCSYDKERRPVKDFHKRIEVQFYLFAMYINLDEHRNELDVHGWMKIVWRDEGLTWNPTDYSNVDSLHVNGYDIWQPDITIYNRGNLEYIAALDITNCIVHSSGVVACFPASKWSAKCFPNLQQWPFDQHNCNVTIGSWTHTGELMDIGNLYKGIYLEEFTSEWEILDWSATKMVSKYDCCPNTTFISIDYSFYMKRHADAYAATVIIPSLALTMLTLASYWLDPKNTNRLTVCCASTFCHCLYLQYLGLKLPANGTMTPIIILLYRDSLIITIVALVLAVVVERLSSSTNDTSATSVAIPAWLDRFVEVVSNQKAGQLLLGKFDSKREDGASLSENVPQSNERIGNQEWIILVTIIDRLGFFLSFITYFTLYIALIPKY